MSNWIRPLVPKSLYTAYSLLDYKSESLKLKGETVIAWPLNYGIMFWREDDVREDTCCNARFFNRGDAELMLTALRANNEDPKFHYEIIKFDFED
jgi:hypothetical protein